MIRTRRIRAAVNATTPLLARIATQAGTTVARYLTARGVHPQWIAQWGSAFGRKAAASYRKAHGTDPRKRHENGRDVYTYSDTTHLDEALDHYRAHPKAGPQLDTGYDRARAATKAPRDARGRFVRIVVITWTTTRGKQTRKLTAADAAELVHALTHHHHVADLTIRDARGRELALAA